MNCAVDREGITLTEGKLNRRILFRQLLSAKLYHRPEKRMVQLEDFNPGQRIIGDNTLKVNLRDEKHGLLIPLSMCWNSNEIRVKIEAGLIVECKSSVYRLMELSLLPELLHTPSGETGYYLTPIGSGTLIQLNCKTAITNRDRIYMDQKEWEKFGLINCFALIQDHGSILGIVNSGDFHAWADMKLHPENGNQLHATFGIRHEPNEVLQQEDKELIVRLRPECRNYATLALDYRDHLMQEYNLVPLRERLADNEVLAYSAEAMRIKIFMGQKMPYVPDGSSPMRLCTTFAEAEQIVEAINKAGIVKAIITIVGWNLEGHDGAYPARFPVEPAFGGEAGLKKLIAKCNEYGYQIVPHDNVTDIYLNSPAFDYEFVSRDEYGEPQAAGMWAGGLSYKVCPVVAMQRYAGDFARIKELGFHGSYYLDAQATGMFRCTDPRHPADEKQFALSLVRILQYPREEYGAVSCELAPVYNLPFMDEAARIHGAEEAFLKHLPKSTQEIIDRAVPFYHIAIHGLILYQANWVHSYRKSGGIWKGLQDELATGARPSMEVSFRTLANGDNYLDSLRDIVNAYQISTMLQDTYVGLIRDYQEYGAKACRITYDTGHIVEVNAGEHNVGDIPAQSIVIRKDGKIIYDQKKR